LSVRCSASHLLSPNLFLDKTEGTAVDSGNVEQAGWACGVAEGIYGTILATVGGIGASEKVGENEIILC
jgi:hypothetical protein